MTCKIGKKSAKHGCRGFALIEIIVVIVIIGIITTIAVPSLTSWQSSLNAGQSAKNLLDALREARSKAMTTSFQYEVAIDLANRQYEVLTGSSSNRQSYNTSGSGWDTDHPVQSWTQFPTGLVLKSGINCDSTSSVNIQFNADGTARLETPFAVGSDIPVKVCLQSGSATKIHAVSVSPSGRITLD